MPFKSEKQRRYLWRNEPKIARKWADEEKKPVSKRIKNDDVLRQLFDIASAGPGTYTDAKSARRKKRKLNHPKPVADKQEAAEAQKPTPKLSSSAVAVYSEQRKRVESLSKSAFGVVHKSFIAGVDPRKGKKIMEMTGAERSQLRRELTHGRPKTVDPIAERLKAGTRLWEKTTPIIMNPVGGKAKPKEAEGFVEGFRRRGVTTSMPEIKNTSDSPLNRGIMGGNVATDKGLKIIVNQDVTSGARPNVGVHEAAHYATDSQARRGKTRSPYRLAQITEDGKKLAREEARADGTAARAGAPTDYAGGYADRPRSPFQGEAGDEYHRVRAAMGQPAGELKRPPLKSIGAGKSKPKSSAKDEKSSFNYKWPLAAAGIGTAGVGAAAVIDRTKRQSRKRSS